ncbi:DUF4112 domain-containing protein [Halobaculum lipolyticum]|uniref:DUF4112 domain-containing protein n=1 Tax=Halobaculum lipolyticum TaxID=3032001 RepID=A0ABD5WGG1_9EURY|nr:DUF4112 domain-containing protein [Halobaculum sp. DT31]
MTDVESLTMDLPESVDEPALRRVRTVARVMDEAVRVPGTDTWIGLDPVLGVLPGAGDLVAGGVSLYIVAEAAYLGVPLTTIVRMLANVAADAVLGSVPVVGPVFDALVKANAWNVDYIEEYVATTGTPGGDGDGSAAADADDGPVTIEITEE